MFVDSHCHLDYDVFREDELAVMERAKINNVGYMMTIGTQLHELEKVVAVAERYPHIFATVGVHPHHADTIDPETPSVLRSWVGHKKVVGIGETGLDYFYEHSDRESQKLNFNWHIDIAREADLPVIIHSRDAEEDTLAILKEQMAKAPFRFLIHCFTASYEFGKACVDLGGYISISGIVTFKNATDLQDSVRKLPLDRLMIETDAPYLAPLPYRGKRNEPSYVAHVAEKVAELKGISVDEVAEITTKNYFDLFSKAKQSINLENAA